MRKKLLIIDPSFGEFGAAGHHMNFNISLAREFSFRKFDVDIIGNRKAKNLFELEAKLHPHFTVSHYSRVKSKPHRSSIENFLKVSEGFRKNLSHLKLDYVKQFDFVLFHSVNDNTLMGALEWIKEMDAIGDTRVGFYDYRVFPALDKGSFSVDAAYKAKTIGALAQSMKVPNILFMTTGKKNCELRHFFYGFPWKDEAFPFFSNQLLIPKTNRGKNPVLSVLGHWIPHKDVQCLYEVAQQASWGGRFFLDVNFSGEMDEATLKTMSEIQDICGRNGLITNKNLEYHEFYERLRGASGLLLPYMPQTYRFKTSGVTAEAMAAGVPIIGPRGTWPEEIASNYKFPYYRFSTTASENVSAALQVWLRNLENGLFEAERASTSWRERNGVENFLDWVS